MDASLSPIARRPVVVGLGGTTRAGSTTERALVVALRAAEAAGASTVLLGGAFLATLPIFDPRPSGPTESQMQLLETIARADGVILATPGYHGSISGVMKNALDTLEFARPDCRRYLSGIAVGAVVTAAGAQAAGTSLITLRAIVHALRGWPTPLGAALNSATPLFDDAGRCLDEKDEGQLAMVAEQVVEFARMRDALQTQSALAN